MGLFEVWCRRLICIALSLCKHACKEVCDVNPGIDPYPLLSRSCDRWCPDFVTFTACKKSRFGLKRDKKAQCVSNRCNDLFERKKYFGVRCTLIALVSNGNSCCNSGEWTVWKLFQRQQKNLIPKNSARDYRKGCLNVKQAKHLQNFTSPFHVVMPPCFFTT